MTPFTAWTSSSFDDTVGERKLRNHFTGQQINRSNRSSDKNRFKIWYSCTEKSFAFKSQFIRHSCCCWETSSYLVLDNSCLKNRTRNVIIRDLVIICKRFHFDLLCLCSTRTSREKRIDFSHEEVWYLDIRINGLQFCVTYLAWLQIRPMMTVQ